MIKRTNTELCLIPSFIRSGGDLSILDEFDFCIFYYRDIKNLHNYFEITVES